MSSIPYPVVMDSVATMAQREQNRLPAVRNVKITALYRSFAQRQDLMSSKTAPKKVVCACGFLSNGVGVEGHYGLGLVPLLMLFFFLEQVLCVMPRVLMSTGMS